MLYLIGLGLGGVQDITLRGLDAIKSSDYLYLDSYTSILCEISNEQMVWCFDALHSGYNSLLLNING